MQLYYELTEEDYMAFNLEYMLHSDSMKKTILFQRIIGPFILMTFASYLYFVSETTYNGMYLFYGIMSLVWYFGYPNYLKWYMGKKVKKTIDGGLNRGLLGMQHIILNEKGVIGKSKTVDTKTSWANILKLGENELYYFLYTSPNSAYIIPKRTFATNEESDTFKNFVEMKILK